MRRFYTIVGIAGVAAIAFLLLPDLPVPRMYLILFDLLILVVLLVFGASQIRSGMFVQAVCKGNPGSNNVAITFDDGPDPLRSEKILEILGNHHCQASFFLTGARAEENPLLVQRMYRAGHTIGNHSYSHSSQFPLYRPSKIASEIADTNGILEKITGKKPQFFRPPFGVTNPRMARGLRNLQMQVIGWSIRSYDTRNEDPEKVIRRITGKMGGGDIILLHESSDHIEKILEGLLNAIERAGLRCVTLEQLLEDPERDRMSASQ